MGIFLNSYINIVLKKLHFTNVSLNKIFLLFEGILFLESGDCQSRQIVRRRTLGIRNKNPSPFSRYLVQGVPDMAKLLPINLSLRSTVIL